MVTSSRFLGTHRSVLITGLLILIGGIYLRTSANFAGVLTMGYDEHWYSGYVDIIAARGVMACPQLAQSFVQTESQMDEKIVPPLRLTLILSAALWKQMFGTDTFTSMKSVSCVASILALPVAFFFGWRLGGGRAAVAMLALLAVAPLQVFMAHRALIDGFFGFFCLLVMALFWEAMQGGGRAVIAAYALSLALLVMTKETSAFVTAALVVTLALNRFLRLGTPTPSLWVATFIGPALGLLTLVIALGGPIPFSEVLSIDLFKPLAAFTMRYADGPWYHYLLALLIISPLLTIFALGGFMSMRADCREDKFMIAFLLLTYIPMAAIPYQAVVRLATIWDLPLAWLAWSQLNFIAAQSPRQVVREGIVWGGLALLVISQFRQFYFFFQVCGVYEPVTYVLLRCVNIIK